jgi:hypothetical protein
MRRASVSAISCNCSSLPWVSMARSTRLLLSVTSGSAPAARAMRTSSQVMFSGTSMDSIRIFSPAFISQE